MNFDSSYLQVPEIEDASMIETSLSNSVQSLKQGVTIVNNDFTGMKMYHNINIQQYYGNANKLVHSTKRKKKFKSASQSTQNKN